METNEGLWKENERGAGEWKNKKEKDYTNVQVLLS